MVLVPTQHLLPSRGADHIMPWFNLLDHQSTICHSMYSPVHLVLSSMFVLLACVADLFTLIMASSNDNDICSDEVPGRLPLEEQISPDWCCLLYNEEVTCSVPLYCSQSIRQSDDEDKITARSYNLRVWMKTTSPLHQLFQRLVSPRCRESLNSWVNQ